MMLALLLLTQTTVGLSVAPSEGGGEVLRLPMAGPPWAEARLALGTPPDPLGKAGLGAVAAHLLQSHLHKDPALGPTVSVRRTQQGLIVALAGPEPRLQALAHKALSRLAALRPTDSELSAAIRSAVRDRLNLLRDPVALARMEAQRVLRSPSPVLGEVQDILSVSAAEAQLFIAATLKRQRLGVVLSGAQASLQASAWPQLLPAATGTVSRTLAAAPPGAAGLQIIVIDRPDLSQAHLHFAWRPREVPSEAVACIAASLLGPSGRWTPPMFELTRSATVGQEAERLATILGDVRDVAQRSSTAQWPGAVATATRALSLSLKDASSAATALAEDLLDPARTLRPVLRDRIADLAIQPQPVATMMKPHQAVVVVVTALGPDLVRQLADLRPDAAVHVYTWDQR